jgi:ABC-type phosphate/phosphonate transport system permease subunit
MTTRTVSITELHRARPRRPFVIWSVRLLGLLMVASWILGRFDLSGWFTSQRRTNLGRFLSELEPWPLRQGAEGETVLTWAADLWRTGGSEAALSTLAISVAAIVLAGILGALLSLPAARNFATPRPFLPGGRKPGRPSVALWTTLVWLTRSVLVFLRALPEYVWAFLSSVNLAPQALASVVPSLMRPQETCSLDLPSWDRVVC